MLQTFKKYWLMFGSALAWINARIILTLLYFVILPFFAIPYKLFLLFKKKAQTQWHKHDGATDLQEPF